MQIELTKEQYELLLKTNGIGNAIISILGDMVENEGYKQQGKEADTLEKHLLGYAKDFESDVQTESFMGETVYTDEEYASRIQSVLSDYDEFTLFDSLSHRLAWRDFRSEHDQAEMDEMAKENGGYFGVALYPYEKKYWDEFDAAGVNRLVIDGAIPVSADDEGCLNHGGYVYLSRRKR